MYKSVKDFKFNAFQYLLLVLFSVSLLSCNDEEKVAPELPTATIGNLEIGSGNNGKGIIGRDFHFDMDVVAATRIVDVQVLIKQKTDVAYAKDWSFDVTWVEFKGAKNTNVHKHFSIPEEAPEGSYDFIIRVKDENGSVKEEKYPIELISAEKLPVLPELYSFMLQKADTSKSFVYILNRGFMDPANKGYVKGDTLDAYVDIRNVKDDGVIYMLLIKKSAGHMPETVKDIDFSKVIVADVREHKGLTKVGTFTNYVGMPDYSPRALVIGGATDNNIPSAGAIDKNKWANGEYYYGIVYTNTTHNMSAHYYIDLRLSGF
jgi:hypothetical protein